MKENINKEKESCCCHSGEQQAEQEKEKSCCCHHEEPVEEERSCCCSHEEPAEEEHSCCCEKEKPAEEKKSCCCEHHDDDDDDCGCGRHHHHEHHDDDDDDCGCGRHHHHEHHDDDDDDDCGCGRHHHHEHEGGEEECGCGRHHSKKKKRLEQWQIDLIIIAVSAVSVILSYFKVLSYKYFDLAFIAVVLCGYPIVVGAFENLIKKKKITASLLVTVALVASIVIKEYFAAGEVALIMQIGDFLESLTVRKAKSGIKELLSLAPDTACLLRNGEEVTVKSSELKVGDVIRIKTGESVACDGVIVKGASSLNQQAITGESMPVDKEVGDEVYEGTINCDGVIEVRATRVGRDSSLKRMAKMVAQANAKKAPVVKIADKMASIFVPAAMIIAIVVGIITKDVQRAVTILVVFCPCALALATPTAIMATVSKSSKEGVVIKSGETVESLAHTGVVAFDKTGTITTGEMTVSDVITDDYDSDTLMAYAASVEKLSEHPISGAIVKYAENNYIELYEVENHRTIVGLGVSGEVNGHTVEVGNKKLAGEENAFADRAEALNSVGKKGLFVVIDGKVQGVIGVSDTIKATAKEAVTALGTEFGIQTVMLTGDNKKVGEEVGKEVGVSKVYAECMPEDKVAHIEEFIKQGKKVAMIGDGVNDAPALATATTGIAMGAIGADIAVESADVLVMNDDIGTLPKIVKSAKRCMTTIKFNITVSLTISVVSIIIASFGGIGHHDMSPAVGALVHNASSLFVVLNSILLSKRK